MDSLTTHLITAIEQLIEQLGVEAAALGLAMALAIEILKRIVPKWASSDAGQRVLGWLPLALGPLVGLLLWARGYGWAAAMIAGGAAGGIAEIGWQVYRVTLRKLLRGFTGNGNGETAKEKGKGK